MSARTRLHPALLEKMAAKLGKPLKYVREQISKRASRQGIASEAAQILCAKELGLGTARPLRELPPHMQDQVRNSLPNVFAAGKAPPQRPSKANEGVRRRANPLSLAVDFLITDAELRSRSKDLLARRRHFDRVVREATTVLETRIRRLSGVKHRMQPEALVNRVIHPDPAKAILMVSSDAGEQAGFHSICRGIMLAF